MSPLDVMHYAMRLELEGGQSRSAASIAEKAAPYVHPNPTSTPVEKITNHIKPMAA